MVRFIVISDTEYLKGSSTLFAFRNRRGPIREVNETQIYIRRFLFSHLFDFTKMVKVRGTPASGKSSLAYLLRKHINDNHPEQDVCLLTSYRAEPDQKPITEYRKWLREEGWEFLPNTVLIIDEAQLSYWDIAFWLGFIKPINSSTPYMVILFASYGSASRNLLSRATPLIVQKGQHVGLARGPNSSIGLLLTREEMEGVVEKSFPNHHFDVSLLDYVYSLTSGHVGACYDAFSVVQEDQVSPYSSVDLKYG